MASITFALEPELKQEMQSFAWISWSVLIKQTLSERFERSKRFERFDEILKNSEMTDELALKLADELKHKVAKRHGL